MKFYKGAKRLFNTVDLELDESDSQHRYIVVPGISTMDELRYSVITILSSYDGVPTGESTGDTVETTFTIKNDKDEILSEATLILPILWVYSRQVYNLFIDYTHEIIPFGANLESRDALANIDTGSGTGFIHLPASILSANDTYTSEQILEAFGSQENIDIFKDAVLNKKPMLFYSDYSEESVLNGQIYTTTYTYDTTSICVYQRYQHEQNMYIYTKESGVDSIANLYDGYKITVLSTNSDFIVDSNITTYVFGFTSSDHDNTVFTKAIRTSISLNSKLSETVGILQEDVADLQKSVGDNVPIGTGMDYFGTVAPENYMFADGSEISRTDYSELFEIIGTTYGVGDGSTTFNLPDKRERVSVMYKDGSTNGTNNATLGTLGAIGGEFSHTQTVDEMPSHTHIQDAHTHKITTYSGYSTGSTNSYKYGVARFAERELQETDSATTSSTTAVNQNTGGGQAMNIMQPYLVCNYIIKVKSGSSVSAVLEGEY